MLSLSLSLPLPLIPSPTLTNPLMQGDPLSLSLSLSSHHSFSKNSIIHSYTPSILNLSFPKKRRRTLVDQGGGTYEQRMTQVKEGGSEENETR